MNSIPRPVSACLVHRSVVSRIKVCADKLDLLWSYSVVTFELSSHSPSQDDSSVSFATSTTLFVVNLVIFQGIRLSRLLLLKRMGLGLYVGREYLILCPVSCTRLETIVVSFEVLALIWRPCASYLNLITVFLAGTAMADLFTTHFIALSAPSRGGHARTTITAYYLA